jgi:RHS repeat-associated protein
LFTGKERDSESGLDNFGARYDSSQYGRFMSPDPGNYGADLTNPQSWNMYSYVLNNPLNLVDPDGLDCVYLNDDQTAGTVLRGDCASDKDNGIFVNGTVDTTKGAALYSNGAMSFAYVPEGGTAQDQQTYYGDRPDPGLPNSPDQMPMALNGQQVNTQNAPSIDQQHLMALKVAGMMAAHGMSCAGRAAVANTIPFGGNLVGMGDAQSDATDAAKAAAMHPFATAKALDRIEMPNIGEAVVSAAKVRGVAKALKAYKAVSPAVDAYNFSQDMAACYDNPDQ